MSKIEFYLKYIFRTEKGGYNNWRFYFPLIGVVLGVISIIITFAIMQGMENEVFKKLEAINFPSKILDDDFSKPDSENFFFGIDKKAIVNNGGDYRVINVRAIEDFIEFKENTFSEFLVQTTNDFNGVIIGGGLASKLNVSIGDFIELVSPTEVSVLTGIPTSVKVKISGIFNLQLLNYDDQYIFTNLLLGETLF